MFGNGFPVRTLKFDFGIGGLLGEGGGVVGTERGVATEESVGDDEPNSFACVRVSYL